jgi:hypothetical protein
MANEREKGHRAKVETRANWRQGAVSHCEPRRDIPESSSGAHDMTGTLALLLTVAAGVVAGVTDLRSPDVQGPVGVLFAAAFLLAAWHPEGARRRGLMLGLSVPLAHLVARFTGHALPYTVEPPVSTLLAIVPAMLGTMVGVGVSRLRQTDAPRKKLEPPR